MHVRTNALGNITHHDGQVVLDVESNGMICKVWFSRDKYWVYKLDVGYAYLLAECLTADQARDAAIELLGEEI
ncbi:MAG TPA: hypothetical protein VGG64_05130 [Pirellulales bacterium]|jgi:hypothetical protein